MKLKQLTIEIENTPGRLHEITRVLGDAGINLRALNLVETTQFGRLRLLVSDEIKARRLIMEMQLNAHEDEVIAVDIEDKPGALADLLKILNQQGIYISYMYAFAGHASNSEIMIFCCNDNDRAIAILQRENIKIYDAESFGMLEKEN